MQQDFDVHAGELQSSAKRRLYFAGSSWRALLRRQHSSLFIPPGQRSAAARSGPHLNLHVGFHACAFKEAPAPLKRLRKTSSKSRPQATSRAPFYMSGHGEKMQAQGGRVTPISASGAGYPRQIPTRFVFLGNQMNAKRLWNPQKKAQEMGPAAATQNQSKRRRQRRKPGGFLGRNLICEDLLRVFFSSFSSSSSSCALVDGCSLFVWTCTGYICAWAYRSRVEAVRVWVRCQVQQSDIARCFCIRLQSETPMTSATRLGYYLFCVFVFFFPFVNGQSVQAEQGNRIAGQLTVGACLLHARAAYERTEYWGRRSVNCCWPSGKLIRDLKMRWGRLRNQTSPPPHMEVFDCTARWALKPSIIVCILKFSFDAQFVYRISPDDVTNNDSLCKCSFLTLTQY